MKNYVITIMTEPMSVKAAERCIESGRLKGTPISKWAATVPNTLLPGLLEASNIGQQGFVEKYSRLDNCMAAFHSHWSLWKHCTEIQEEVTIFEHDAVIVDHIPELNYNGCISFGKPSYGQFNIPARIGKNILSSKRYFPGAHAYRINPWGAQRLIERASKYARPTDVFLHLDVFPWLEEYYPWPVEARDTFTTIQKTEGCLAKHSYNGSYKII